MLLLIFCCCWVCRHPSLTDLTQKPKRNSIKKQLHFSARALKMWLPVLEDNRFPHGQEAATLSRTQKQTQQEDTIKSFRKSYQYCSSLSYDFHERFSKLVLTSLAEHFFSLSRLPNSYPGIMAAKTWQCRSLESLLPLLIVVKLGC